MPAATKQSERVLILGGGTPPPVSNALLREDSGYILREDGSKILREA